jgi:hypothetical protein
MHDNNEEVQREVEERTGTQPCIWQIEVVRMVLDGKDITNDALQPVEAFVRAMTHDHHYHHLLLYVEVSFKFLASFKTVLTMYIKAAFRRTRLCFQ